MTLCWPGDRPQIGSPLDEGHRRHQTEISKDMDFSGGHPMAGEEPAIAHLPLETAATTSISPAAGTTQYEFSPPETEIIGNLGSKMSFVGLFMLGIGLFCFLSVIARWVQLQELEVALLFFTLLMIPVGIWTHRAGREFRSVAMTEGNDVAHLMGALANLLKLCTLVYLILFIGLVFAIIQLGAYSL
jgi:hypothetical protein